MFRHTCEVEEQQILGQRPNPLDPSWNEWTLIRCRKCATLAEWQHHSDEQAHGGDLQVTACATAEYARFMYGLTEADISLVLASKKLVRRYSRYTQQYEEMPV